MKWYLFQTLVCFSILGALNARPSEEETCKQLCKLQAESQTILIGKEKDQFTKCLHGCLSSQNTVEFSRSLYKDHNYSNKVDYIRNRTKRAAREIPRKRSCNSTASSDFVGIVNNVTIDFQKTLLDVNGSVADHWTAVIGWSPLTDKKTANLWTHYVVQWMVRNRHALCRLVAKNVTSLVLNNTDDWQYPDVLELNVSTYPLKENVGYRFSIWRDPRPPPKFHPITLPTTVSTEQLAIILIGCSVGFVMVVIATVAWKLRRSISASDDLWTHYVTRRVRRERRRIESTQSELTVVEDINRYYVSYYPESEDYVDLVVKLVCILRDLNYDVIMDRMSVDVQQEGPIRWAHQEITNSYKVLVLCSPNYLRMCQKCPNTPGEPLSIEESRVWYEIEMLGRIFTQRRCASKMVCIWMNNGIPEGLPPWMHVTYKWPPDFEKILARLDECV